MTANPPTASTPEPSSSSASASDDIVDSTGVLVITGGDDGDADRSARRFAAGVAQASGVVTIYDRSEETWGDSQHPEGPMQPGDERLADRPRLRSDLEHVAGLGARTQGWVATLPSISAAMTALSELGANLVVVPATLERKLLERGLEGETLAQALCNQIAKNPELEARVVEMAADGTAVEVPNTIAR